MPEKYCQALSQKVRSVIQVQRLRSIQQAYHEYLEGVKKGFRFLIRGCGYVVGMLQTGTK